MSGNYFIINKYIHYKVEMISEKKSKLTLVVDGNWLLMSRFAVLNSRYTDDEQMCKDLKIMMIKSINIVLKQFPTIDNIIFVSDGGSWRNTLEKPSFMDDEYKGNRIQDPNVNWDLIFSHYEDFIAKLRMSGITVSKEQGIEGDDWCWYWSQKLNSEGTNVIIWSRDKDLTQLVHTDKNKCFTVCWSKENGIITDEFNDDDMDFLFNNSFNQNEEIFTSIVDKAKSVKKINPHTVVVDKIIRGDAGDNIFPIILRTSKPDKDGKLSSDRVYKVSTKDMKFDIDIHNQNEIREYISNLIESKSYVGRVHKSLEDIIEHFNYNVKLVTLEKASYPQEVLDIMETYDTYNCCKNTKEAEYQITAELNQINAILDII